MTQSVTIRRFASNSDVESENVLMPAVRCSADPMHCASPTTTVPRAYVPMDMQATPVTCLLVAKQSLGLQPESVLMERFVEWM